MSTVSKNSNIARVNSKLDVSFFYKWLSFLGPFHDLTKIDKFILANFLYKRFELSKVIKDENILDNILRSVEVRKEIRDSAGYNTSHFNLVYSKLKKNGVIVDGKINRKYIPNIEHDSGEYRLVIIFDLKEE